MRRSHHSTERGISPGRGMDSSESCRMAQRRARIQRMVDGKLVEIKPKMTDLVQPNDTIVVPQRFF